MDRITLDRQRHQSRLAIKRAATRQIINERLLHLVPGFFIGSPQHRGRMHSGHNLADCCADHFSALLADAEASTKEGLASDRAQTHDDLRPDDLQLGIQPRATRCDLTRTGPRMQPPFASRFPFEVLDGISEKDFASLDTSGLQGVV